MNLTTLEIVAILLALAATFSGGYLAALLWMREWMQEHLEASRLRGIREERLRNLLKKQTKQTDGK